MKIKNDVDIETLLVRSEGSLSKFLSKPTIEVLSTLDPNAVRPENLITLIKESIQVHTILKQQETRGVLIRAMKKNEAEEFAKFIGIKEWEDVHYKLLETKFTKKVLKKALEFFGKEYDEEPDHIKKETSEIGPEKVLFPHQIKTVKKIGDELAKKPHKALLHMPTGSGKTISAMRVILIDLLKNPDALIIWLAYNEELCEQAMVEFQSVWKAAGDRKINAYRFYGKSKINPQTIKNGFMIASLSKMLGSAGKSSTFLSEIAKKTNLVVIDEAHQAIAEKFSIVIKELAKNKDTKLLGLSATPGRKSELLDSENLRLAEFFDFKKVIIETGNQNPIKFLIKNGYLAKPKFTKKIFVDKLSRKDLIRIDSDVDIPKYVLEKLSDDAFRNLMIVDEVMQLAKNHKKIIVFTSTVEHARSISLILSAKKYRSHYITSKTPSGIRANILDQYKNTNHAMILCNFGILTTGFDAPRTSAIVIARPTKSQVLYAQMVGRGIRGPRAGGNKTCQISTIVDKNIHAFINVTEIFTKWEGAWHD